MRSARFTASGRDLDFFAKDLLALTGLPAQLAIGFNQEFNRVTQIFTSLIQRVTLRDGAWQFLGVCYIAAAFGLRDFLIHGRECKVHAIYFNAEWRKRCTVINL